MQLLFLFWLNEQVNVSGVDRSGQVCKGKSSETNAAYFMFPKLAARLQRSLMIANIYGLLTFPMLPNAHLMMSKL